MEDISSPYSQLRLIGDNSITNLIKQGQILLQSSSDSAKLDAEILLCFVLNKERSYLLTWPEKVISDEQLHDYLALLLRRINGEPIAYITRVKEFWSLPLIVSQATLIPRPDTETLVELVLEHYQHCDGIRCLDLGTGTGAIALALASEMPSWKVEAIDYSEDAVKLAQENATNLQLTQVSFYQSDWFSQIDRNKTFEVIVSNPPYIDETDINLSQGDVRFEPKSALVSAEHGLADIKHIATCARDFLKPLGQLYIEHGFEQGQSVRALLSNLGYQNAQTQRDLNGHERITWCVYPEYIPQNNGN